MIQSVRGLFLLLIAGVLSLLQACAVSPYAPEHKAWSDKVLSAKIKSFSEPSSTSAAPRLFVLAAALHDQSKAFRGDVDGFTEKLLAFNPQTHVIKLSNPVNEQSRDLPFATRENLNQSVRAIATAMRENDRAVIMLTTHGNVNLLGIHAGAQAYPPLTGQDLKELLSPLEKFEHGVIISACFSGSLIPALTHNNRWVMSAAASNRPSFGCQFHGTQTYFIDALLNQNLRKETTLRDWFSKTRRAVTEREQKNKLLPSEPQIFIPRRYTQPLTLGELLATP